MTGNSFPGGGGISRVSFSEVGWFGCEGEGLISRVPFLEERRGDQLGFLRREGGYQQGLLSGGKGRGSAGFSSPGGKKTAGTPCI